MIHKKQVSIIILRYTLKNMWPKRYLIPSNSFATIKVSVSVSAIQSLVSDRIGTEFLYRGSSTPCRTSQTSEAILESYSPLWPSKSKALVKSKNECSAQCTYLAAVWGKRSRWQLGVSRSRFWLPNLIFWVVNPSDLYSVTLFQYSTMQLACII